MEKKHANTRTRYSILVYSIKMTYSRIWTLLGLKITLLIKGVSLIIQYSHLFTGFWLSKWMQSTSPGPCVLASCVAAWSFEHRLHGLLIEPDQFIETASRLAQLPHQRDSNNCTLWPLPDLKKPYLCSLQSKHGSIECPEKRRPVLFFFLVHCLDARSLLSSLGREQRWFTHTSVPNSTVIRCFPPPSWSGKP